MLPGCTCTDLYNHAHSCMHMYMYAILLVVVGKVGWSLGGMFFLSHDAFTSHLCPYHQLAGKDHFCTILGFNWTLHSYFIGQCLFSWWFELAVKCQGLRQGESSRVAEFG